MRIPEVTVFEMDAKCYELRKGGLTYKQIAQALDCSPGRAHFGVKRVLTRVAKELAEENADVLQLELERLDELLVQMLPLTRPHDIEKEDEDGGKHRVRVPPSFEAVDRVLKIMDRRARLLGLENVNVTVRSSRGEIPMGTQAGQSGEITPADEARSLLKVMSEAGVLDPAIAGQIRAAMGEEIVEAEVISDTDYPELEETTTEQNDSGPFYGFESDEDEG